MTGTAEAIGLACLALPLLVSVTQADTLILPQIADTGVIDITQPGLRIQDGVIYETHPGPLGIINQMGTTYKRVGDELVPHNGILGPQDFTKPSYRVEDEDDYMPRVIDNRSTINGPPGLLPTALPYMIYRRTHDGRPLRRELSQAEEQLLVDHYRIHHAQLTKCVQVDIARYGFCLILDGHTYPADPMPFEDPSMDRPPVCLGTDPTHSPDWLVQAFVDAFHDHGLETGMNTPYAGTLVPEKFQGDARVMSLMIETRKDCYSDRIRDAVELAVANVGSVAMANRRHTPRCPVAEFAKFEDNLVNQARARHLRDYQAARAAGLPLPDLFDYMPTADQLPFTAFGREWLKNSGHHTAW